MGRTQTHAAGGGLTQQPPDAAEAAREAGLTYASDIEPGIRRAREGKGFVYTDPEGRVVRDPDTLDCIRSLASALGGAAIKTPAMLRADEAAALALLKRAAGRKVSKAAARLYQYGARRSSNAA